MLGNALDDFCCFLGRFDGVDGMSGIFVQLDEVVQICVTHRLYRGDSVS